MAIPQIQGNLPFQSLAGAGQALGNLGGPPAQAAASLGPAYATAYKSALDFNTANYGNVLKGYQDTLAGQQDALSSIGKGYTDLSGQVLGGLANAGASERQRIADAYAAQSGAAAQSLVNRGLGNSTVVDSTQRGLFADAQKQYLDLADRLMQERAGYQSQLGLAGLAQQQQAALANTGLAQNQLGFMERVNAPYPDAALYAQLASQYGMAGQADKDRQQALQMARAGAGPVGQSPGTVSRGGGGFFTQPADFSSSGSYQPQSFAPQQPRFGPPPGTVLDARPDPFSTGGYSTGLGAYAAPSGAGFSGGFGDQGYGYSQPAGEDQPYGQPAPAAAQTAGNRYGGYSAGGIGGQSLLDPSLYGGYDPAAYGLTQSDLSYYGY